MKKSVLFLGLGAFALAALAGCKNNKADYKNVLEKYEAFNDEKNKDKFELGKDYFKFIIANPDTTKTGEDEYHYKYYGAGETIAEFNVLYVDNKSVYECLQAYDVYDENVSFLYSNYDVIVYFSDVVKDDKKIIGTDNILLLVNDEYSNYTINNFTPAGADKKLDTIDDNLKELTVVKNGWDY